MTTADIKITHRIVGIDSLRFVCAVFVFFSHGSNPPFETLFHAGSLPYKFLHVLAGTLWNGPAAVVVFFVISGFCIHFPFLSPTRQLNLVEFYSRRLLRLLIPAMIAAPIGHLARVEITLFRVSILWSLLAELIYYGLYPLLRVLRVKVGSWIPLIIVAYIVSLLLIATHPSIPEYPLFSPWLTWLVALPSWLLGCALAEAVPEDAVIGVSASTIWKWRIGMLAAVCVSSILRFHAQIGFPWTFAPLAILVTFWLRKEIAYYRRTSPFRFLEWAGLWSYSLYLMHIVVKAFYLKYEPKDLDIAHWSLSCLLVFVVSYAFYLLVEKPSHIAAKQLSILLRAISLPRKQSRPV